MCLDTLLGAWVQTLVLLQLCGLAGGEFFKHKGASQVTKTYLDKNQHLSILPILIRMCQKCPSTVLSLPFFFFFLVFLSPLSSGFQMV
jgi:hypothetical protein